MGLSLTYLSLVILFNSFFMSNFLLIRALRRHMDATFRQRHGGNDVDQETAKPSALQERILENKILLFFLGPPLALYLKIEKIMDTYQTAEGDRRDGRLDMAIAFCFGYTRKRTYESRRFPHWDPVPYKLGAFTTTILIVLFSVIFSDTILNNVLGLDPESTSPMGGVCTEDGLESKVQTINRKLLNRSNFVGAIAQNQTTAIYLDALQEDTALWGEPGHECRQYPRNKIDFRNSSSYGNEDGLSFFPGVCEKARDEALTKARNQTCVEEFCSYGMIIDDTTIGIDGLENLEQSIEDLSDTIANLEIKCNDCPKNGGDAFVDIFTGTDYTVYIDGQDEAEKQIDDLKKDVNKIDVKYGYKNASFCSDFEIPCPDYSKYDELSKHVPDYRLVNLERSADIPPVPPVTKPNISETYYEVLQLLLRQVEIATYLYSAYKCLSLFFPTPQLVFKVKFSNGIRQYLFGIGKYKFLVTVLAIWWTIEYLNSFPIFMQLDLYMKLLVQEPCVANKDYATKIGDSFSTVCNTLLTSESQWANNKQTIGNIIELIGDMEGCCTDYPNQYLGDVSFMTDDGEFLKTLGFEKVSDSVTDSFCTDCYLPIANTSFVGNLTACEDNNFVVREIMELNEASTISWWDIWISSGVLASLLLSPVVANYGISLAKLADPLMACDGKYEGPPEGFNFGDMEVKSLMQEIIFSLKYSAFGRVVFWGILMNLLMINVILGKMENDEETTFETDDAIVAGCILGMSLVTVLIAARADKLLSKRISLFAEGTGHETEERAPSIANPTNGV